jgi:divalent metal cation (Fe/Co/Zn/Cd) transporter
LSAAHPQIDRKTELSLYSKAFGLAVFTILYNIAEGLVAVYFGYEDESLTLFGFGIDSFIEFISGLGIAHMIMRIRQNPNTHRDNFERTALRVTGYAFYILVAGLVVSSILNIISGKNPETTFWGVVISVVSILVMVVLLASKMRIGKALHSEAILADASCTRVCIYMSVILLTSSAIYEFFKIPYVDAVGSLGLAYFSFREGKECFGKARSEKYCGCDH